MAIQTYTNPNTKEELIETGLAPNLASLTDLDFLARENFAVYWLKQALAQGHMVPTNRSEFLYYSDNVRDYWKKGLAATLEYIANNPNLFNSGSIAYVGTSANGVQISGLNPSYMDVKYYHLPPQAEPYFQHLGWLIPFSIGGRLNPADFKRSNEEVTHALSQHIGVQVTVDGVAQLSGRYIDSMFVTDNATSYSISDFGFWIINYSDQPSVVTDKVVIRDNSGNIQYPYPALPHANLNDHISFYEINPDATLSAVVTTRANPDDKNFYDTVLLFNFNTDLLSEILGGKYVTIDYLNQVLKAYDTIIDVDNKLLLKQDRLVDSDSVYIRNGNQARVRVKGTKTNGLTNITKIDPEGVYSCFEIVDGIEIPAEMTGIDKQYIIQNAEGEFLGDFHVRLPDGAVNIQVLMVHVKRVVGGFVTTHVDFDADVPEYVTTEIDNPTDSPSSTNPWGTVELPEEEGEEFAISYLVYIWKFIEPETHSSTYSWTCIDIVHALAKPGVLLPLFSDQGNITFSQVTEGENTKIKANVELQEMYFPINPETGNAVEFWANPEDVDPANPWNDFESFIPNDGDDDVNPYLKQDSKPNVWGYRPIFNVVDGVESIVALELFYKPLNGLDYNEANGYWTWTSIGQSVDSTISITYGDQYVTKGYLIQVLEDLNENYKRLLNLNYVQKTALKTIDGFSLYDNKQPAPPPLGFDSLSTADVTDESIENIAGEWELKSGVKILTTSSDLNADHMFVQAANEDAAKAQSNLPENADKIIWYPEED